MRTRVTLGVGFAALVAIHGVALASSCEVRCDRFLPPGDCGRLEAECSGSLFCIDGDCGGIDGFAWCRNGLAGNWFVILECGQMTNGSPDPEWDLFYRRFGEAGFAALSSRPEGLGLSRDLPPDLLAQRPDYVLRVCPGSVRNETGASLEGLTLSASSPLFEDRGFAIGSIELTSDGARITLQAAESLVPRDDLRAILEESLLGELSRTGPLWFALFWNHGFADGVFALR